MTILISFVHTIGLGLRLGLELGLGIDGVRVIATLTLSTTLIPPTLTLPNHNFQPQPEISLTLNPNLNSNPLFPNSNLSENSNKILSALALPNSNCRSFQTHPQAFTTQYFAPTETLPNPNSI